MKIAKNQDIWCACVRFAMCNFNMHDVWNPHCGWVTEPGSSFEFERPWQCTGGRPELKVKNPLAGTCNCISRNAQTLGPSRRWKYYDLSAFGVRFLWCTDSIKHVNGFHQVYHELLLCCSIILKLHVLYLLAQIIVDLKL